ncbi:kinesin-like protein KIFC3 [Neolamprologus brichardi]|uniref:kinesin-like protein KIFC3 n=1 Tax=Neolamprologus brichardi TaxID=32507 RepID=UPI001643DDA5|nr:kinesin-like protein KIFC3 [Neolamprologus brichardi]
MNRRAEGRRRRGGIRNLPNGRRHVQPVQRSSALVNPAVMFGTRKTWDLGHAPCLQDLWKKDLSLDASSVDFLMSDGEDDGSFLSLPSTAFSQRPSLTAELSETSATSQQLIIQTLQDKVCEFQARLHSEEVARHLLVQQLQQSVKEKTCGGVKTLQEERTSETPSGQCVEELEEKLLDQTQEVERLRSELGATDLEKQLELLLVENERLKQELKSCRSSKLQKLDAAAETCSCSHCPHSQDAEALQREVSRWETQARQRERRLAELERELLEKSSRMEALQRQLDDSTRQLDDSRRQLEESRRRQGEAEQKLTLRLQECEEELARQAATPPRVKYGYKSILNRGYLNVFREAHRTDERKGRNSMMCSGVYSDTGLHLCASALQILVYEGEMERAQGQLEAEMQNLEEEKNRVIEEAFIRAESEMKAVHENLAVFGLQGNIRVFCRVRPVSQEEQDSADAKTMLSFDSDDDAILYLSNKGKVMTFELDKVFPPHATQEEVFQEVQALITSCVDGYNVCIFAYGQTGSGKTYTMEGVADNPGINQRALRLLFSEVSEKAPDWDYKMTVSMVEIYNETLRDLLGENPSDKLDIKMNPDGSGQLYVPGLTEITVQSPEDINKTSLS